MQDSGRKILVSNVLAISLMFILYVSITQNQVLVHAQEKSAPLKDMNLMSEIKVEEKWSFYLFILALITTVAAVIGIFAVKLFDTNRQRRQTYEALSSILRELKENKKALTGTVHEHIVYYTEGNFEDRIQVSYTNAYLELESYESVHHSGLIAHTEIDTQQCLTMLYSRIRSRNELLTYVDRYEDLFFLTDESEDRKKR